MNIFEMEVEVVFPAHAGMFRVPPNTAVHHHGFPRARGDVP